MIQTVTYNLKHRVRITFKVQFVTKWWYLYKQETQHKLVLSNEILILHMETTTYLF